MSSVTVEQRIKQYILEQEIPQTTLSELTGITKTKINLSLNGKRRLSFVEYELICGALEVSADKFISPRKLKS